MKRKKKESVMVSFSLVAITHIIAIFLYINLAAIIYASDRKAPINRFASLLTLCFGFWTLNEMLLTNTSLQRETAYVIERLNSIGWILAPLLLSILLLHMAEEKQILKSAWFRISAVVIPSIMLYFSFTDKLMDMPRLTKLCWYSEWKEGPWFYSYILYMLSFTFFSMFRLIKFSFSASASLKRKQARAMVLITFLTVAAGTIMQIILPNIYRGVDNHFLMSFTNSYLIIWAVGALYTVLKYRFLRITPTDAADDIVSNMTDTLLLLDSDLNVVFANETALQNLKYTKETIIGKSFSDLISPKDFINFVSAPSGVRNMDLHITDSSGKEKIMNFSVSVLQRQKKPKGFVLVARDIRERIEYEERIKEERDMAKAYLETANIMFVALDNLGTVTLVNKKALNVLELKDESEIIGKNWFENFIPKNINERMNITFKEIIKGDFKETVCNEVLTKNGTKKNDTLEQFSYQRQKRKCNGSIKRRPGHDRRDTSAGKNSKTVSRRKPKPKLNRNNGHQRQYNLCQSKIYTGHRIFFRRSNRKKSQDIKIRRAAS